MSLLVRVLLAALRYPPEPADPEGSPGSVRVVSASSRYLAYRLFTLWSRLFLVFAVEETLLHRATTGPVHPIAKGVAFLVIFGVPGLIASLGIYAEYKTRSYKLSDRALRIREGLLFVRETTMTYANIQNVNVSRGPVQGLFGISDVVMKTAGGAGGSNRKRGLDQDLHVAHFRGLENADEVRALVLDLLRKTKDAGLGDVDDAVASSRSVAPGAPSLDAALAALGSSAKALRETAERL